MTGYLPALAGGALVGLGLALVLFARGRIAGVSGILGGLLGRPRNDARWRLGFLAGLAGGGAAVAVVAPELMPAAWGGSLATVAVAGVLVGFETRLGNGCTSGHGVCGTGRLAPRSLAATATFIATGALTVWVLRALGGGA